MGGAASYIIRVGAPSHQNHSTEATAIDSCAAYSMAGHTMLVPLSWGTKITLVTEAFPIKQSLLLHCNYEEHIQQCHAMSRFRIKPAVQAQLRSTQ